MRRRAHIRIQERRPLGLYNVVRQVCGSIGIAVAATMVPRGTVLYRSRLVEHLIAGGPGVTSWLHAAQGAAAHLGTGSAMASRRALAMLNGYVTRQAAILAYNHVYQIITLAFVACLPLVLLLRRPKGHVEVEIGAE